MYTGNYYRESALCMHVNYCSVDYVLLYACRQKACIVHAHYCQKKVATILHKVHAHSSRSPAHVTRQGVGKLTLKLGTAGAEKCTYMHSYCIVHNIRTSYSVTHSAWDNLAI